VTLNACVLMKMIDRQVLGNLKQVSSWIVDPVAPVEARQAKIRLLHQLGGRLLAADAACEEPLQSLGIALEQLDQLPRPQPGFPIVARRSHAPAHRCLFC
jgi:hypothetical protein